MAAPLNGVKVLELAEGISGPFCTKLLADYGAEVIKVERPHAGDCTRQRPPFFQDIPDREHSLLFAYLNTNKRSITLDLDGAFGQDAVRKLAAGADVVVQGDGEEAMQRRGLDAASLHELNRRLVVTSISLFENGGRFSRFSATELNLYAFSGLLSVAGGGVQGRVKAGGYQTQYLAGLQACAFTLFCLYRARLSGEGGWVDTSVVELSAKILEHCYDVSRPRRGSLEDSASIAVYPCKDGHVTVTLYYYQIKALGELIGAPWLAGDPRFASERALRENRDALRDVLQAWTLARTADEAQDEAQKRHLLFTKVNNARDLVQSQHLRERGFFSRITHPAIGQADYPRGPFRFSDSNDVGSDAAPLLGEANEAVLCRRLGHSREDLVRLRSAGSI